ncbi:MAG TPA: ComEC/Rec2 family competence protein [Candidatus Saccharimonadia bacterium]|jgi:competence protein ComEC|nr:ComEC/Rec2 family competence protein [Candidatus Saccharimonadia bacterium]
MRQTTKLSLLFGALLAGIALGYTGAGVPGAVVAGVGVAALVLGRSRVALGAGMLAALTLGLWCHGVWAHNRAELAALIGQKITVTGAVADDPSTGATGQVDFKLGELVADGRRLPGTLSVHSYPVRVQRGYRLELSGKVKAGYGTAVAEIGFPKIQVLSMQQSWLERLRQRFFAGIRTALPEPIASFGLGLLVGIRALIPKPMQAQLALVGLSHLVAVSGYNLTIIVAAVDRLFKRAGRGVSLAVSLWLIAGFLVVTGASASIVRAGLVSVLSLLAGFYGRRFNPITLILIAAGVTAAFDPGYLTDLGWLLSFLAFFGILVLAPAVEARLGHPKSVVIRLFIESFAAQILTLPLILLFFGQLSIVAPITNLLILPLVPLAMAVSFVAGMAGMLIPAFAGWLAWPAMLVLGFITNIIGQFAALPWAGRTDQISWAVMLVMYALILVGTLALKGANKRRGQSEKPSPHLLEPVHS